MCAWICSCSIAFKIIEKDYFLRFSIDFLSFAEAEHSDSYKTHCQDYDKDRFQAFLILFHGTTSFFHDLIHVYKFFWSFSTLFLTYHFTGFHDTNKSVYDHHTLLYHHHTLLYHRHSRVLFFVFSYA